MKKKNLLLGGYLSQEIRQGGDMLKFLLAWFLVLVVLILIEAARRK